MFGDDFMVNDHNDLQTEKLVLKCLLLLLAKNTKLKKKTDSLELISEIVQKRTKPFAKEAANNNGNKRV